MNNKEEIKTKISDLRKQMQELEEELKKEEKKVSIWDRVENGKNYFIFDSFDDFNIHKFVDKEIAIDDTNFRNGNYCQKAEPLEKIAKIFKLYLKMYRWKEQNDPVKLDWNNESQKKYYLYWNYTYSRMFVSFVTYRIVIEDLFQIYFSSASLAHEASNIFKDEIEALYTT